MAERSSDEQFRIAQREIRESIRRNHPNPGRVGCVGTEKLGQMAEGAVPPTDPAYHHVMECSPCYEELMDLSERASVARKGASARRRVLVGSIAALLIIAAALVYVLSSRPNAQRSPGEIVRRQPGGQVAVAMLNLDSEPTQRSGDGAARAGELQRLPRKQLDLTINLPRGLDEGLYEVEIDADTDNPILTATGNAKLENGLTVLVVKMDLSHLSPGKYRVRIRRQGESWRDSYVFVS